MPPKQSITVITGSSKSGRTRRKVASGDKKQTEQPHEQSKQVVKKAVQPLMSLSIPARIKIKLKDAEWENSKSECETDNKGDETKQLGEKDRSRQSPSTSDSSKTISTGIKEASQSELHEEIKEVSQQEHTDTSPVRADTSLETESSKDEKNNENVTKDELEQLANNSLSSAAQTQDELKHETKEKDDEVKDQLEGLQQSAVDNEPTKSNEDNAEEVSGSDVVSGTDQHQQQPETSVGNTKMIAASEDSVVEQSHANSAACEKTDSSREMPESDSHAQKVQSDDKDQTEQPHLQSKHEVKETVEASTSSVVPAGRRREISTSVQKKHKDTEWDKSTSECPEQLERVKRSRERSETEILKPLTTSESQHHAHRRPYQSYKQDESYSRQDKERFAYRDSRREKHDAVDRHYYYGGHRSHHTRHRDHSRRYLQRSDIREGLELENISSDEEDIKYQDCGNHCCQFCQETFETISSLLEHLQSAAHEQVFD